ncbi:MAG: lytic transglycosylase domain-containing protein [Alphaproteobacteria bacterium]|nr:lytic transglycosylase domain-containing protein [Alphaproteobacteria bacterium]
MRPRLLTALIALVFLTGTSAGAVESPTEAEIVTAAITPGLAKQGRKVALPTPLSNLDAANYRAIFAIQARGQFDQADRQIGKLQNRLLMGHVLAQRLLHPAHQATFPELKAWMDAYADHPQAPAIWSLARKRMPAGAKLKQPVSRGSTGKPSGNAMNDDGANWEVEARDNGPMKPVKARFRQLLRDGDPAAAETLLGGAAFRAAGQGEMDDAKAQLAAAWFAQGDDRRAAALAIEVADRAGDVLPTAHWTAGLSLWRLNRLEEARRHFEAVANAQGSPWMIAAGAFWAARANLVGRRPEVVNHWLQIAADHSRTFYGLLARRALAQNSFFDWEATPFTDADVEILTRIEGGHRAMALLQVGEKERAEDEILRLHPNATPAVAQSMLALASAGGMPELALRLGTSLNDGRFHDTAAYPLPSWQPTDGWQVDKALVFALVRQESKFNPAARSRAGATGLMQLMPATARYISGGRLGDLNDPAVSLALGQRYVQYLLEQDGVRGNLMMMLAAYNAGPNTVARWRREVGFRDDALLFLESIPSRETRIFTERVLTNLWIYRSRLGQASPSLDALAAGNWPLYDPQDPPQSASAPRR